MDRINLLMEGLRTFPKLDHVFNPWAEMDPLYDATPQAPAIRQQQLARYFKERVGRARYALVAEGSGYAGCKFSGIAMTDERVLLGQKASAPFPRGAVILHATRTSNDAASSSAGGMTELTSSVLYRFLFENRVSPHDIVTWNAFPFHPHQPSLPLKNRTPRQEEIDACRHLHDLFFEIFPACQVVAVGKLSEAMLKERQIPFVTARHPAFGGAPEFCNALTACMRLTPRQPELAGL